MADLPAERKTPGQLPFTFVRVGWFGPFSIKKGRSVTKRYGVIFSYLVACAVHIEVAHSLDTDSFINSLKWCNHYQKSLEHLLTAAFYIILYHNYETPVKHDGLGPPARQNNVELTVVLADSCVKAI